MCRIADDICDAMYSTLPYLQRSDANDRVSFDDEYYYTRLTVSFPGQSG